MTRYIDMSTVIFTLDFSKFDGYDKYCEKHFGYRYSDLIKREQNFLKKLLDTRYPKIKVRPNMVIMVYIHAGFGVRRTQDYKIVTRHSKDYFELLGTDDWSMICDLEDFIGFAKLHLK